MAVKEVVAEGQRHRQPADELAADQERLRDAAGLGLYSVVEGDAELAAVPQQAAEGLLIGRGRDDQYLADARQHQSG